MHPNLRLAAALLGLQLLAFPLTRVFGLYAKYWPTDVILHILAGIMLGSFWLWLVRDIRAPSWHVCLGTVMFAVFGSVLWEFWEFAGWRLIGDFPYYIPTLSDTLGDILSGLGGGVILCLFRRHQSR